MIKKLEEKIEENREKRIELKYKWKKWKCVIINLKENKNKKEEEKWKKQF